MTAVSRAGHAADPLSIERTAIRLLLVGPSLDYLGGQAIQLQRLLQRFQTIPSLDPGFLPVNPRLPGPLRALQRLKYVRTVVTTIAYLASLLRRVPGAEIVHAFSASYWSFLLSPAPALVVARLFGRAAVLNYRSGEADDHLTRWGWNAIPFMRLAHVIVVPSDYLVGVFARHGLRAIAIPNFVELAAIPYRRRAGVQARFLSNRNFEPLYNVACTLRAFARIQAQVSHASLTVIGDGSLAGQLRALAEDLRLRNVTFVGRVEPSNMPGHYNDADVYLNTPNIDNMPNSILEAFAAGVPVVTTDAGGIPHIVRDGVNGLLVSRDDDEALAAAALRLLNDDALALRLADHGRQEAVDRYSWPAVENEWVRCYTQLRDRRRANA